MAISTKNITGKIVTPDGVGWAGGSIYYSTSASATVDDGGAEQIVGATKVVSIQLDGSVDFDMIPNDIMTPADTIYVVRFFAPDGSRMIQYWRINNADSSPISIGDVEKVVTIPGGYSSNTLEALLDTNLAGKEDDDVLGYDEGTDKWTPRAGGGGGGTDTHAFHDNDVEEIFDLFEKVSPGINDILVIEDSATGHSKKKVKMSSLPGGALSVYTTGTKPSAIVGNAYVPYIVKDSGEHAHGEIIYQRDDDSYDYWITWTAF
jgi:hypothetical protein